MKKLASLLLLLAIAPGALSAPPKLDLNDVSWLWPVPRTTTDLASVITMTDLKSESGEDVWSDDQFADLLAAIDDGDTEVGGEEIDFGTELRSKSAWRVASMRVDPSAPGGAAPIRAAFGSSPQIRLIVQPVTVDGRRVEVHDVAVHLVYDYLTGVDDAGRKQPDNDKFMEIIEDLDRLKQLTESGGAPTSGRPLGFHPGLRAKVPGLHQGVKQFLSKHLSHGRLSAMAVMGLPNGVEPWIFFGTTKLPNGRFGKIPVPIPAAAPQMVDFRGGGEVSPEPVVNNRNPITPQPIIPAEERRGVATAVLFGRRSSLPDMNAMAVIGVDAGGNVVRDTIVRNKDIPDVIAHPGSSHFFNTDCVSCHSETTRREALGLSQGNFAFRVHGRTPAIHPEVATNEPWNVHNFGWFPPHPFIGGGRTVGTVTQRTANETAEVVEFIERHFRSED